MGGSASGIEDEVKVMSSAGETVTLAGREYTIKPLPLGKDLEFRSKLATVVGEIGGNVYGLNSDGGELTGDQISALMPVLLSSGFDSFVEMLFLYSPELRADRQRILSHLDDDTGIEELISAGEVVFRLAAGRVKKILSSADRLLTAMMLPLS